MQYVYLGRSGLKVSKLSFGNWLTADDTAKHEEQAKIFKRAYELGINFFDTAETYGFGKAEISLGNALKEMNVPREKLVISTKLFWSMNRNDNPVNENGLSRKHIHEGIRNSLRRLGLDYVDITFCHRFDYDVQLEEICRSMSEICEKGLSLYWGTSEWPAAYISAAIELCRAKGWHEPVAEQCQYNMLVRQKMESDYIPLFTRYGYGTTIWSPLAGGLLSGKYNDGTKHPGRFDQDYLWQVNMGEKKREKTLKILNGLAEIAKKRGYSQAQLALAWTLANSATSTCILGASRIEQLEENVKALDLFKEWKKECEKEIEELLDNTPPTENTYKMEGKAVLNRERMLILKKD